MRAKLPLQILTLVLAVAAVVAIWKGRPQPKAIPGIEQQPPPGTEPIVVPIPDEPVPVTPPTHEDAETLVATIFRGAAILDTSQKAPYATGDFNADGSMDVALVVRPASGGLPELNSDLANWIPRDPRVPPTEKGLVLAPNPPVRAKMEDGDVLLAVIHGHEARGWRDPLAKQVFLLKGAGGRDLKPQRYMSLPESERPKRPAAHLKGDVLLMTLNGQPGILFWEGSTYLWKPRR
jgi:hypothetical protein